MWIFTIRLCKLFLDKVGGKGEGWEGRGVREGRGGLQKIYCIIGRALKNTKSTLFHRLYRGMCVKPGYNYTTSCWIHRICRGFTDADGKREFLFALPRFARDEVKTLWLVWICVTTLWSKSVDTMLSSFIFNSFYTVSIEQKPLLFAANVMAAQCCELCYSQHRLVPTQRAVT